jgi:hypothetical protein
MGFALSPQAGSDAGGNAFALGYTGPVSAFQPSSSPAVVETWHKLSLSGLTGWTNQSGGVNLQYKLTSDNKVHIEGELAAASGAVAGVIGTLPVGYRPPTTILIPFWLQSGVANNAHCEIDTNGNVLLTVAAAAGVHFINGIFALDTI